ncbi:MAG TPA: histidinol-phosphatase HisJ family protein [Spirochaetota bacterium]|nr:histidinol-phosphatase HisJ family protein [Spirochaetota bacterium]HRZ27183.1 histidinol-phosphatase HisJ family protein [Spirochaetota bacterium]
MINYHVHTSLCRHATGTIDEYIRAAADAGLHEIGFSDHAPIPLPMREGITMEPGEVESYIALVLASKEKYADSIDVRLGFEVDYPLFGTFDDKYFSDPRIDFITGSCHFIGSWAFDHPREIGEFEKRKIDDVYAEYYSILRAMAETGRFDIFGHFDLVKKFGHRPVKNFSAAIEGIARVMARAGTAAEINTSGLQKPVGEMYPSEDIVKILFDCNVPVTIGTDAHAPDNVAFNIAGAIGLLKKTGYRKISGFRSRKRYEIAI